MTFMSNVYTLTGGYINVCQQHIHDFKFNKIKGNVKMYGPQLLMDLQSLFTGVCIRVGRCISDGCKVMN